MFLLLFACQLAKRLLLRHLPPVSKHRHLYQPFHGLFGDGSSTTAAFSVSSLKMVSTVHCLLALCREGKAILLWCMASLLLQWEIPHSGPVCALALMAFPPRCYRPECSCTYWLGDAPVVTLAFHASFTMFLLSYVDDRV